MIPKIAEEARKIGPSDNKSSYESNCPSAIEA